MKAFFNRMAGGTLLFLLQFPLVDRAAGFVAWQRRRITRRRVERRLDESGHYPDRVMAGPFAGMVLPPKARYLDARFEKTFGAYEPELFPAIEHLSSEPGRYRTLVNIGAADGFFCVGLGLRFPDSRIVGFEMQQSKRETLLEVARLNGAENRIDLRGRCSGEDLDALRPELPALLICDVDGFEETLLDPQSHPVLSEMDLLVETHDCYVPGITRTLIGRFAATHEIDEIPMRGVDYSTLPILNGLTMPEIDALVGSERPSLQSWLVMRRRTPTH